MDAFTLAIEQGYYFDCCIDLYAFKKDGYAFILKTPTAGAKPEITIDGNIIPGNYDVQSHISIRNLSYQVDIDEVVIIKARMYYKGLVRDSIAEQSGVSNDDGNKPGHWVTFSVLYATQEGEPPNRAVKFNCVIASEDFIHLHAPVKITKTIVYGQKLTEGGNSSTQSNETEDKKVNKVTGTSVTTLLDFLVALAAAYNQNPNVTSTSVGQIGLTNEADKHKITKIRYHGVNAKELQVSFVNKNTNVSELLLSVNQAFERVYTGGILFDINFNSLCGELYCMSAIILSQDNLRFINESYKKYFDSKYSAVVEVTNDDSMGKSVNLEDVKEKTSSPASSTATGGIYEETSEEQDVKTQIGISPRNPIPLNFIKSAFKDQSLIKVSIIFDHRVFPMAFCSISGKLLMGRGGLGSGINTSFNKEKVIFQIVGGIKYTFSTIQGGVMSFEGVADPTWQKD